MEGTPEGNPIGNLALDAEHKVLEFVDGVWHVAERDFNDAEKAIIDELHKLAGNTPPAPSAEEGPGDGEDVLLGDGSEPEATEPHPEPTLHALVVQDNVNESGMEHTGILVDGEVVTTSSHQSVEGPADADEDDASGSE